MSKLLLLLSVLISISVTQISCSNTNAQKSLNQIKNTTQTVATSENISDQKEQQVKISTEYGDMIIKLYNETPLHRDNFIKLAKEGFYNGCIFHRVINGFMIQGGDPSTRQTVDGLMSKDQANYTIPAEFNPKFYHKKGALAAARTGDDVNPTKASSGSQFYIVQGRKFSNLEINTLEQQMGFKIPEDQKETYMNIGGTPFLDRNYTVYGEVISGLDVIDKIAAVKTLSGDKPEKDIVMKVSLL